MKSRCLVAVMPLAIFAAPALAQAQASAQPPADSAADAKAPAGKDGTAVSGVTVTPDVGKTTPKGQCADEACIKQVVRELKARFPQVYRHVMQACMVEDTQRASLRLNYIHGVDDTPPIISEDAAHKMVCDQRYAK